jgi:hypothetical protein
MGLSTQLCQIYLCGAAWVFYCSETGKRFQGEFAEQSTWADSYRGEQLGMLAIHLILLTVEEHYGAVPTAANIFCDNKGTILTFSKEHKRVPTAATNNDVLRVIRRLPSQSKLFHRTSHVKSHQDDHQHYSLLTIQSKLNCECDTRAKRAIYNAATRRLERSSIIYILPMESAAVFIDGEKQTNDLAKELRYLMGKAKARQFYADEKIMDVSILTLLRGRISDLSFKADPRCTSSGLANNAPGFCGTGDKLSQRDRTESNKCPNCGFSKKPTILTGAPVRSAEDY